MKLHLCCGDVYLRGYINCDIEGESVEYWPINPNETTLEKYFKYPFGSPRRPIIRDNFLDMTKVWPIQTDSVKVIVMISSIEHFNKKEGLFIVSEINRVLRSGGKLIIDFPDLKKNIETYYETNPEFLMELIYCNQKNEFSYHKWGYTEESFKELLGSGWKSIERKTIVHHDYPMIGIEAIKC